MKAIVIIVYVKVVIKKLSSGDIWIFHLVMTIDIIVTYMGRAIAKMSIGPIHSRLGQPRRVIMLFDSSHLIGIDIFGG